MTDTKENAEEGGHTVVDRALARFAKAVGEQDGLAPVAARLTETLLKKRDFSEVGLRAALFGDPTE